MKKGGSEEPPCQDLFVWKCTQPRISTTALQHHPATTTDSVLCRRYADPRQRALMPPLLALVPDDIGGVRQCLEASL